MTRRFTSPLYLRIEDIPEYARAAAPRAGRRSRRWPRPLRAGNGAAGLIDRDAVWAAKRAALELIYQVPLTPRAPGRVRAAPRPRGRRAGSTGPPGARWPRSTDPTGGAGPSRCATASSAVAGRRQPGLARRPSSTPGCSGWPTSSWRRRSGRRGRRAWHIGIIHDLAVGAHPGGADAWAHQDLLVPGVSVGAPPDELQPARPGLGAAALAPAAARRGRLPAAGRAVRRRLPATPAACGSTT